MSLKNLKKRKKRLLFLSRRSSVLVGWTTSPEGHWRESCLLRNDDVSDRVTRLVSVEMLYLIWNTITVRCSTGFLSNRWYEVLGMKESGKGVEGRRGGCEGKRKVIFERIHDGMWREWRRVKCCCCEVIIWLKMIYYDREDLDLMSIRVWWRINVW